MYILTKNSPLNSLRAQNALSMLFVFIPRGKGTGWKESLNAYYRTAKDAIPRS